MGHALKKEDTEETNWLRRNHPQLGRSARTPGTLSAKTEEEPATKYPVLRRLSSTSTTFVHLCKEKGGQFVFKLGCGIRMPVPRDMIADATATTANSDWATIRISSAESLRLKRSDLRDALRELDKL
jgi:hypothetical protein